MAKNRFFDIPKGKQAPEGSTEKTANFSSKYLLAHYQKVKHLQKDLLGRMPTAEECFFLQTDGQFNAFTFIPLVLQSVQIQELFACTYSIGRRTIEALVELHDSGMVDQITLLISDSMRKRNPVTMDLLFGLARDRGNITVKFAWTHAKVCLLKTISGHYIIEGSGNWNENAHYEQYLFANSAGLYEFRKELFMNAKFK